MTTVYVKLDDVGAYWLKPCKEAVGDLNTLFKRSGIAVVLSTTGSDGAIIKVKTDSGIQGDAVHGRTSAETTGSGKLLGAEVRLPVKVTINTPQGIRDAGVGIREVIAAHEFVHALGHPAHNTKLMGQTLYKEAGDTSASDKLKAGGTKMPPLALSDDSIEALKSIWS